MIRTQQNALKQHFKIEDPFFTAVPEQIVFLYAEFKQGGVGTFYEEDIPKICRKKREKYVQKFRNTIKLSVGTTTYIYMYIYTDICLKFLQE